MDSQALGAALSSMGGSLDTMADQGFKQQIDQAKMAQTSALAQLKEQGDNQRQAATQSAEDARQTKALAQSGNQFQQTFGQKQAVDQNEIENRNEGTKLRASEVSSGNAERAASVNSTNTLLPHRVQELDARAAGAEANTDGIPKAAVAAITKEYETANAHNNEAQSALAKASQNKFDKVGLKTAQDNATQAAKDLTASQKRLDAYSRVDDAKVPGLSSGGGVAPKSSPKPMTSQGPAKVSSDADYNLLQSGTKFIGPDGQLRVKP